MMNLDEISMNTMFHYRLPGLATVLVASLVLGGTGCSGSDEHDMLAQTDAPGVCLSEERMHLIETERAYPEPVSETLRLSGSVMANPDRVYPVYPAAGGIVSRVHVRVGDRVNKGDALATIESPDIAQFRREMMDARASVTLADRNLDLAQSLYESGVYARQDVLEAERMLQSARAEVDRLERRQRVLGIDDNEQLYTVRAPESGFVLARTINPGLHVDGGNGQMLFKVSDLSKVWVAAHVFETDIHKVGRGSNVQVQVASWPEDQFPGEILRISQVLDPERRLLEAIVELENSDFRLKPGMFSTVSMAIPGEGTAPAVTSDALIFDNNRYYVVVYRDACDLEIRRIQPGLRNADRVFIEEGLTGDEQVITRGQLLVYNELLNEQNDLVALQRP